MDLKEVLTALGLGEILSALGGGTLVVLSLIQISPLKFNPLSAIGKWIGRSINAELLAKIDAVNKRLDKLDKKTCDMIDEEERREAEIHRVRILRFGDEIAHGVKHSKDHFDQILLSDVDFYETYCKNHPEFKNSITVTTTKRIREVYERCIKTNDFL